MTLPDQYVVHTMA